MYIYNFSVICKQCILYPKKGFANFTIYFYIILTVLQLCQKYIFNHTNLTRKNKKQHDKYNMFKKLRKMYFI